jgi:serine protease
MSSTVAGEGPGGSLTEYQIIQEAMRLGALVVAGVGNNGTNIDVQPFYPASYPGVLSVGGTSTATQVASWSNYGVTVQVYAPGGEHLDHIAGERLR